MNNTGLPMSDMEIYNQCARIADEISEYLSGLDADETAEVGVFLSDHPLCISWTTQADGFGILTGSAFVSDVRYLSDVDYLYEQVCETLNDWADSLK